MQTAHKAAKARLRRKRYVRERNVLASRPDFRVTHEIPLMKIDAKTGQPVLDAEGNPEKAGVKVVVRNYGKYTMREERAHRAQIIKDRLFTKSAA